MVKEGEKRCKGEEWEDGGGGGGEGWGWKGDWEREVRPWKVTVVPASSIQVMGSSAAEHVGKREDRESEERGK